MKNCIIYAFTSWLLLSCTLLKAQMRMVFWSDNQGGFETFRDNAMPLMIAQKPDLLLTAGDLVSDGAQYDHWVDHLYGPGRELFRTIPWYPVRGTMTIVKTMTLL